MQAALGISQLNKVDHFIAERRKNWKTIYDGIKSSPILKENFTPIEPTAETNPSWFGFAMYCHDRLNREKVVRSLEENKVGTRLFFAGNLTKQPAYKNANYRVHDNLNNTDTVMRSLFWIGVHPALDAQKIAYMLEQLEAVTKVALK